VSSTEEKRYFHASDQLFRDGAHLTGGHRLDDLYLAGDPAAAAAYYSSGYVYEVDPDEEPAPAREGEYTVSGARVVRRLGDAEVLRARSAAYNSPEQKARRARTSDAQALHRWRSANDRWYRSYEGPDRPGTDEITRRAEAGWDGDDRVMDPATRGRYEAGEGYRDAFAAREDNWGRR
jgi:hypothetical protein